MSEFIGIFSTSIICDLNESLDFSEKNIKKIFEKIPNYIKSNIKKYRGLKDFLGKKRKPIENINIENNIENQDVAKNVKYLKKNIDENNLSINIDINKDILIKVTDLDKTQILRIYDKPIVIAEIYDQSSMNINLINDYETFHKKYKYLQEYDFKIYSLNDNSRIIDNEKIFENDSIKTFEIEEEKIRPYLVLMRSKIPEIKEFDMNLENIYPINEIEKDGKIYPQNISKIFFYYFNINKELQKTYEYINSKNREKLFQILATFLNYDDKKIIIICGSKGIGKTTSLIKFSFINYYNIFYFNLEAFNKHQNDENQLKELKIQVAKLFGKYFIKDDKENIKDKIIKYIDSHFNENSVKFIYNIIDLFLKFTDKLNMDGNAFCFIIDQYSLKFDIKDEDEYDIDKIINLIKKSNKVKLILCPTINNIFAKRQINYLFNKALNPEKKSNISVYYFQELISTNEMKNNIMKNENEEYINYMDEIGYIPKLFYDSKNLDMTNYKNYLKSNLKKNLNEYFTHNNNIDNNIEMLKLIDLIKGERLICSKEFSDNVSKLPLKYLKIYKYMVNKDIIEKYNKKYNLELKNDVLFNYISFLFKEVDTEKFENIIDISFIIEERNINYFLDNYYEKDNSSLNIYGDYYKTFVKENTKVLSLNYKKDYTVIKLAIRIGKIRFEKNFKNPDNSD